MLKTKVLASEIANLTDARYFAALEVEWLCFNLQQGTATYIEPQNVIAIKEWVEGPKIVGSFGFQETADVQQAISAIGLDAIQLGHFVPMGQVLQIRDIPIIKEIFIDNKLNTDEIGEHLFMYSNYVSAFLLKGSVQWSNIKENPSQVAFLRKICKENDIIIAFEFKADEIEEMLEMIMPAGIEVTGGEEEAVGVKSFDELDELFDNIIIEE